MKTKLKLIGIWLEIKFYRWFGIKQDPTKIPHGIYCYVFDSERNEKEPEENSLWIKTCHSYLLMIFTANIDIYF